MLFLEGGVGDAVPHLSSIDALLDAQQLNLEDEGGVGGDGAARAALAVAELGGDDEAALPADLHPSHALVPALDDLARAELEIEGLAAIQGGVELLAVLPKPL